MLSVTNQDIKWKKYEKLKSEKYENVKYQMCADQLVQRDQRSLSIPTAQQQTRSDIFHTFILFFLRYFTVEKNSVYYFMVFF